MARVAFVIVVLAPWTLEAARMNSQVTRAEPPGVGCAELSNTDQEALMDKIPGAVQGLLTSKGLDNEYMQLVNDLLIARKGRAGTWKGSALYRTMVLHRHTHTMEAKNITLFLTKTDSAGWFGSLVSSFKVCLVDRLQQPDYEPTGVYVDSKEVDIGYGDKEMHTLPDGVVGTGFDGTLDSDLSSMPVNIFRLLQDKDLLLENAEMAAMINTAEADSLWAAKVVSDFMEPFKNKGVGLFFAAFNSMGGTSRAAGKWGESDCPAGTLKVKSAAQCEKLARANGNSYDGTVHSSYYPGGCNFRRQWRSDSVFTLQFNSKDGDASSYAAPMCQKLIDYEESLKEKEASFKYWIEYADLSKTGESYVPKLHFGSEATSLDVRYPMGRITAYNKCDQDGDSKDFAERVHAAIGKERLQCGQVAGAEGRDSKAYPACKCGDEGMEVYCGNRIVAARKFDIASVLSIEGCSKETAYCSQRPCGLPKMKSEL